MKPARPLSLSRRDLQALVSALGEASFWHVGALESYRYPVSLKPSPQIRVLLGRHKRQIQRYGGLQIRLSQHLQAQTAKARHQKKAHV